MTGVHVQMEACIELQIGMRVRYNCPLMSEDYQSQQFFQKYRGREATIVGFSTQAVSILDKHGRPPGIYYNDSNVDLRFDGEDEVHKRIKLMHLVLVSSATTAEPKVAFSHQRAGDLPSPILFYPGDVVYKYDDLLRTEREVSHVEVDNEGKPTYYLRETELERDIRLQEQARRQKEVEDNDRPFMFPNVSPPRLEGVSGEGIGLLRPGNLHLLYTKSGDMQFETPEEEVTFWSQDGLSEVTYRGRGIDLDAECTYEEARRLLEAGEGDLVVRSRGYGGTKVVGRRVDHKVLRLHDCFAPYRDRVRSLSLSLSEAPIKSR